MSDPAYILLGDQPHTGDADPLGFSNLTVDLARLILASRRSTPFALGIEASWGMGKSTLMHRLKERLRTEPGVTPVWFNAWTADERGVLEGLIKTVLEEMDPNVLRRALRHKNLMSGLRALFLVLGGLLGVGNVVDEFWKRVAVDPRGRNELRDLMARAVEDWRQRQAGVPEDALLCVFIDDVDRCAPGGAFEVFEAMKLYLDVPGFVFIVGYVTPREGVYRTHKGVGLSGEDHSSQLSDPTFGFRSSRSAHSGVSQNVAHRRTLWRRRAVTRH